jgi:NAD(P)-dependent dehydrogenase (short-subunit alcohol dehydrogenase family)
VRGTILTIREALKRFGPAAGSIINIGSLDSARAIPGMSVYAGTKGAVDALTRVLAAELGPCGFRASTLAPDGVKTEGIHASGFIGSDAEKEMIERTPLGRMGQPQDLAKVDAVVDLRGHLLQDQGRRTYLPIARRSPNTWSTRPASASGADEGCPGCSSPRATLARTSASSFALLRAPPASRDQ